MTFVWKHVLGANGELPFRLDSSNAIRLAQVKEVMETVVSGRKYEVMRLRMEGKTVGEIALLLSISKSAVRSHYRRGILQVRKALGLEHSESPVETSSLFPPA